MPQTPYFVRTVSLAAAIARGDRAGLIAQPGEPVTDVGILTLPAGAVGLVFLHLGQKGDPIPLRLEGQNFHLATPEDTGIWVSTGGVGALNVDFLIGLQATLESRI